MRSMGDRSANFKVEISVRLFTLCIYDFCSLGLLTQKCWATFFCYLNRNVTPNDGASACKTVAAILSFDLDSVKRGLSLHLENLKIRYDLIAEQGAQLQRALIALEDGTEEDMPHRTRIANECAIQFRTAANALTLVSAFQKLFGVAVVFPNSDANGKGNRTIESFNRHIRHKT